MKTAQEEFRDIQSALSSLALRMFDLKLQSDTGKLIDLVRMLEGIIDEDRLRIQELERANKILNRENAHLRNALQVAPNVLRSDDEIPF